jgi:trimeric autotransporter adhesin
LEAGDGADSLDGGLGADKLIGGNGDDTYIVDNASDTVDETGSDGVDTIKSSISLSLANSIVGGDVENLTLTGKLNINGEGNALDNIIDGNSGKNRLLGAEGADRLSGLKGNDQLDGGAGEDVLTGGAGKDTFIFGNALGDSADVITDFVKGQDKLDISLAFGDYLRDIKSDGTFNDLIQAGHLRFQLVSTSTGESSDDSSIQNTEILWDSDGATSDVAAPVLIATLEDYVNSLVVGDFVLT